MQPQHIGDIEHCLAVCSKDADMSKVAEDPSALILRFATAKEVPTMHKADPFGSKQRCLHCLHCMEV